MTNFSRLRSRVALAGVMLTVFTFTAGAQSNGPIRFGASAGLQLNFHSAAFGSLPGFPTCCEEFQSGFGFGPAIGAQITHNIASLWSIGLRADFSMYDAALTREERFPVIVFPDDKVIDGMIEHRLHASLPNIGLEPILVYQRTALSAWVGPRFSYLISDAFDQREQIMEPSAAVFADTRQKVRNEQSASIPGFNSLQVGLTLGLGYDIALNTRRTTFLQPQLSYFHNFTSLSSDVDWNAHGIRFGLAVMFAPQPPSAPEPVPADTTPTLAEVPPSAPRPPALETGLKISAVNTSGRLSDTVRMLVDESTSMRMHPLLHYVFFEANSSALPHRYKVGGEKGATTFNPQRLRYENAVELYHHVLDIVGYRMRANAKATIVLTGTTSGDDTAPDISLHRAETVRNYLTQAWGIGADRIRVVGGGRPQLRSNERDARGKPENQRVEIASNDARLFDPIMLADTLRTSNPPDVIIEPSANRPRVEAWSINVMNGDAQLKDFVGAGAVPRSLSWQVQPDLAKLMDTSRTINVIFSAADHGDRSASTVSIPVDVVTLTRKRIERRGNLAYDRFDLILFEFDKAAMSAAHRSALDIVRERISAGATVTITGYTDVIGDFDHNSRLSCLRARVVHDALGKRGTVKCGGEFPMHDMSTPEGRFYARMVRVEVSTPVE